MITYTQQESFVSSLTADGAAAAEHGSPEARVWAALKDGGKDAKELQVGPLKLSDLLE
jgi:hypothetical protein